MQDAFTVQVILNAPQSKKKHIDLHFQFWFLIKLYVQILQIYVTKKFNSFDNRNQHP